MKRTLQIVLSLVVSAFFVWLSLRGKDLSGVVHAVRTADLRFIGAYALVLVAIHFVRTIRWGMLLAPVAKVSFGDLNLIAAVGFMALMVLPARLGEFARPFLVARQLGVRKSASLASVIVERVVDGVAMGAVLVVLLWTLPAHNNVPYFELVRLGSVVVTIGFAAGLSFLVVAYTKRESTLALVRRIGDRVSPRLTHRITDMLDAFIDGLHLGSPARTAGFLGLTTLYWTLAAAGLLVIAPAFGLQLTLVQAFTVLGLQVVGSMVPAGPGMIGPMQFVTIIGVKLFVDGPDVETQAAAYAHTIWAMQFGQQVLFGLVALTTGRVKVDGLWRLRAPDDAPPGGTTTSP